MTTHLKSDPVLAALEMAGGGPWELDQPLQVVCFAEDSIAVLERSRITLLTSDGTRSVSSAIQALHGTQVHSPVGRLGDDSYLFAATDLSRVGVVGTVRNSVDLYVGLVRESARDRRRIYSGLGEEHVRLRMGAASINSVHPFGRTLLMATSQGRLYATDSATDSLLVISPRGIVSHKVLVALVPRRLTRAVRETYVEQRLARLSRATARAKVRQILAATRMPETLAVFDRLCALREGGVLLRFTLAPGDSLARWLELDDHLSAKAIWQLPASLRVLAAERQGVLGVTSDDDGTRIQYLPVGTAFR